MGSRSEEQQSKNKFMKNSQFGEAWTHDDEPSLDGAVKDKAREFVYLRAGRSSRRASRAAVSEESRVREKSTRVGKPIGCNEIMS
jgi:hypothetical protein